MHWHSLLSSGSRIHSLWNPVPSHMRGAADAFAEGEAAGIGGWLDLDGAMNRASLVWFSLQFGTQDLPVWWDAPVNLQSAISSFELLAQVARVIVKHAANGRTPLSCVFSLQSDSTPAEGRGNKLFSTNPRLGPIWLNLAAWATRANVDARIKLSPGTRHLLADALSHNHFSDLGLSSDRSIFPNWDHLWNFNSQVTLLPEDVLWHPSVKELSRQAP